MQSSLFVRYLVEILLATVAAALFYRYSRRHPARVAALGARVEGYATRRAMLVIGVAALLPLVLRLAVLPWVPPRIPRITDEFGHVLVADTLAHGRLANPPHALAAHLETLEVLQSPAYASKYPIGQGLVLAIGTIATGAPWAGVWLFMALMCGAITWLLLGVVPAGWAAMGGVLAAIVLAPPHGWIDMLYGGAFGAFGGAALFGALVRLWKGPSRILGLTAGLGWGILWLTRPYESLVPLVFTWVILLARVRRERRWRAWAGTLALLAVAQLGAGSLTALHNRAVTGSFTTHPNMLHQRIYGVPQSLLGQPPVEVVGFRTPENEAEYRYYRAIKEEAESHPLRHVWKIVYRASSFFLKEWLYVPALVGLATLGDPVMVTSAILLGGALLSSSLFHSFFPHYWAAYTGVIFLLAIRGLMRVWQWQPSGRPVGKAVAAFFIVGAFATILRAVPIGPILGISDYGDPETLRHKVATRLSATEGQHVVFVKYGPTHRFMDEWVYNGAEIDASRIVWCRAITPDEDARVIRHYEGRRFWLAEVGSNMVRVTNLPATAGSQPSSGGSSRGPVEWVLTIEPRARSWP